VASVAFEFVASALFDGETPYFAAWFQMFNIAETNAVVM
jgi:hypothetical protein